MEINYRKIGFRIGQRRKELKIKQTELAETINVSSKYISNLETGKRHPSLEILINICSALNVTPDYLLMGSMKNDETDNLLDDLKLCSSKDKKTIEKIIQIFVENNGG